MASEDGAGSHKPAVAGADAEEETENNAVNEQPKQEETQKERMIEHAPSEVSSFSFTASEIR
eukprot:4484474-Prorocentrum_lima.AAC.1